jgi:hypothetical protein
VREALEDFAEHSLSRVDRLARELARDETVSRDQAVEAIVSIVFSELAEGETEVEVELILAISREPSFAPTYLAYQQGMESRLTRLMRTIGSTSPKNDASIVLNFTRGFEMEQLSRPRVPVTRRRFKNQVARLVSQLLA